MVRPAVPATFLAIALVMAAWCVRSQMAGQLDLDDEDMFLPRLAPRPDVPAAGGDGAAREDPSARAAGEAVHLAPRAPIADDDARHDDDVGEVENQCEQVDMPEPLVCLRPGPPKRKFVQRSAEHIAHARQALMLKCAHRNRDAAERTAAASKEQLRAVSVLLPSAARLIGTRRNTMGRQKVLTPSSFVLCVRAMFLSAQDKVASLGVRFKRLVCMGAQAVMSRQQTAFQVMLTNARKVLDGAACTSARRIHIGYLHMWDEVNTRFIWNRGEQYAKTKVGIHMQTLCQRGQVTICMSDEIRQRCAVYRESFLAPPVKVLGTRAEDVWPAIVGKLPRCMRFDETSTMLQTVTNVSSVTFFALCDRAASNLSVLRRFASHWERHLMDASDGRILFFPETCCIHGHHRSKLQCKAVRGHTLRHFGIAHLVRHQGVLQSIISWLEREAPRRIDRVPGPPPEAALNPVQKFLDVLIRPTESHHQRGEGARDNGLSARMQAAIALGNFFTNIADGRLQHHCWNEDSNSPCCADDEETTSRGTALLVNSLFGAIDPIPAESTWTHTVRNFKQSLLRALVLLGAEAFPGGHGREVPHDVDDDVDAEAGENYKNRKHASRATRTYNYMNDKRCIAELATLTVILDIIDAFLLYPFLGDGELQADGGPSKADLMLDPNESLLARCGERLWDLIAEWQVDITGTHPWTILSLFNAPVLEESFARFCRCQVLRVWSAVVRRQELKFADFPYKLYAFTMDSTPVATKEALAMEILRAHREDLDVYTLGLRRLCRHQKERLLSRETARIIKTDLDSQVGSTDLIERLNSELTAPVRRRAPARNFANASREALLAQLVAVHRRNAGRHPLRPQADGGQATLDRVLANPLLPPTAAQHVIENGAQRRDAPPLEDARREAPTQHGPRGDGGLALVAASPDWFGTAVCLDRHDTSSLTPAKQEHAPQDGQKRKGLSPKTLEINRCLHEAKRLKGSTMTEAEVRAAREAAIETWDKMHDKSVFHERFSEWQMTLARRDVRPPPDRYTLVWGGGSSSVPLTCEELWRHHVSEGWPSDETIYDDMREDLFARTPAASADFPSDHRLWGVGRALRNVARRHTRCAEQMSVVEAGVHNYLCSVGKELADSGEMLLLVSGRAMDDAATIRWHAAIVSGTCYNPKVFDMTNCSFAECAHFEGVDLEVPCLVRVCSRPSRLTPNFTCIDSATSDEWIKMLTDALADMTLWRATYTVALDIDQSLRWSRIASVERVGKLWELGLKSPLLGEVRARRPQPRGAAAFARMQTGDPLDLTTEPRRPNPKAKRGPARRPGMSAGRQASQRVQGDSRVLGVVLGEEDGPRRDGGAGGGANLGDGSDDEMLELERRPDNVAAAPAHEDEDFYDAFDDDLGQIMEEDSDDNLADAFDEDAVAARAAQRQSEGRSPLHPSVGGQASHEVDVDFANALRAGFDSEAPGMGLEEAAARSMTGAEDDGVEDDDGCVVAAPAMPASPWEELSDPEKSGYCYYRGYSRLRVQYGRPKNSVTISCYFHSGCGFLVSEAACPPLADIKKWLFDVPPSDPTMTTQEQKALSHQHKLMAKERWYSKRGARGGASSSSTAAAASTATAAVSEASEAGNGGIGLSQAPASQHVAAMDAAADDDWRVMWS